MAATHITLGTTSYATQLGSAITQLSAIAAKINGLYAIFGTMLDSPTNPTVFTALETALGLQAGQGAVVYSLLADAQPLTTNDAFTALVTNLG